MKLPTIAAAAVLALAVPAQAADTIAWGTVGNWQVRVDQTLGRGCFIVASYDSGTVVRLGLNPEHDSIYVMIADVDWTSLEVGQTYDIQMHFDRHEPWGSAAPAVGVGASRFLSMETGDASFIAEFAGSQTFVVSYEGAEIARLDLTGSRAAVQEMTACQQAMSQSADDPFAVTPTPADPFA